MSSNALASRLRRTNDELRSRRSGSRRSMLSAGSWRASSPAKPFRCRGAVALKPSTLTSARTCATWLERRARRVASAAAASHWLSSSSCARSATPLSTSWIATVPRTTSRRSTPSPRRRWTWRRSRMMAWIEVVAPSLRSRTTSVLGGLRWGEEVWA